MRFHGLMVLRDEGDVIAQNLEHLLGWIDGIYILDLGSTDQTWEIVQDFSRRDKRVVPFRKTPILFNDNLRGTVFDQYRGGFDTGDWVMRLDADEFYHIPPPQFVRERLRPLDSALWLQWYYFRLTKGEVDGYESGNVDTLADRRRPIEERRRFYKICEYPEPRMFRYRKRMKWPENSSFPFNAGFVSRARIPIRHYPHRDPLQMQNRFRLRAKMMSLNAHAGGHWKLGDWRDEVVDDQGTAEASRGDKRGISSIGGMDTGPLYYWELGTELRELHKRKFTAPRGQRMLQRLIHPLMLPILDARRKSYDTSYQHAMLPDGVQESLRGEMSKGNYWCGC